MRTGLTDHHEVVICQTVVSSLFHEQHPLARVRIPQDRQAAVLSLRQRAVLMAAKSRALAARDPTAESRGRGFCFFAGKAKKRLLGFSGMAQEARWGSRAIPENCFGTPRGSSARPAGFWGRGVQGRGREAMSSASASIPGAELKIGENEPSVAEAKMGLGCHPHGSSTFSPVFNPLEWARVRIGAGCWRFFAG